MNNIKKTVSRPSGCYFLVINVDETISINVGRLGVMEFIQGYYVYIGSALNGQLLNRVKRHCKPSAQKKNHWHIDYLLNSENSSLIKLFLIPSSEKIECELVGILRPLSSSEIKKFGCSDCKCSSHLLYFSKSNNEFNSLW